MSDNRGILLQAGKPARQFVYIAGAVLSDGSAQFEPFEIISCTEDIETRPASGQYLLTLEDSQGKTVAESSLEPSVLSVPEGQPRPFGLFMPYDDSVARITLTRSGQVLAERRRSNVSPSVTTPPSITPAKSGRSAVSWNASDPEKASLTCSLWYTSDGERWLPLAVGLRQSSIEVDLRELPASERGQVRVLVSNGLNTTQAVSSPLSFGRLTAS